MHVLETLNFTEEERMAYEDRLKWWRLEAGTIEKFQKKAKEEGMQQDREEGMQEGIQIGQEQGKLEGERDKALAIAKAMLLKDYVLEDIILLTGLSRCQIEQLM